jgi:hypothetical protein
LSCPQVLAEQPLTTVGARQANLDFLGEATASEHARIDGLWTVRSAYKENSVLSLQAADFHKELVNYLDVVLPERGASLGQEGINLIDED